MAPLTYLSEVLKKSDNYKCNKNSFYCFYSPLNVTPTKCSHNKLFTNTTVYLRYISIKTILLVSRKMEQFKKKILSIKYFNWFFAVCSFLKSYCKLQRLFFKYLVYFLYIFSMIHIINLWMDFATHYILKNHRRLYPFWQISR